EDHDAATGHVLTAVVTHAFDDRGETGVAYAEPLTDLTAQEDLARRAAVADRVAGDDLLAGVEGGGARRTDDDATARESLADIVVAVTLEAHRDALRHEGAERLACGSGEGDVDRAVGQAFGPVALGDLVPE